MHRRQTKEEIVNKNIKYKVKETVNQVKTERIERIWKEI